MNNHHLLLIGQILCVSSNEKMRHQWQRYACVETHPGMWKHTHLHMKSTYTYGVIPQNIEFLHQLWDHNVLWCEKDFNWEILNQTSADEICAGSRTVLRVWTDISSIRKTTLNTVLKEKKISQLICVIKINKNLRNIQIYSNIYSKSCFLWHWISYKIII